MTKKGVGSQSENLSVPTTSLELSIRHFVNVRPRWCPAVLRPIIGRSDVSPSCGPHAMLGGAGAKLPQNSRTVSRILERLLLRKPVLHKPKKLILGESANHGSIE